MPNPAKKTVKRLPLDSAAPEEVVVDLRMMTWSDVTAWHTIIQPIIDATYSHWTPGEDEYKVRADVGWDWSANYSLVLVHNLARLLPNNASGRAFAMSLVVLTDDDEEIPVGMLTAVPEFQCQIEGVSGTRAFAWYLSDAPREFYTGLLGVAPIRGVATALLDCAVISGISAGGNGETLLHADPRGGPKLQEFYRKKCGMKQVKMENGAISLVRRFNTDQYFYMDPATAIIFTSKLDHRR